MSPIERSAARRGVKPPSTATLRKYGLTVIEWLGLLKAQGWKCPVCHKSGAAVKWNTDHDHVPGWKAMAPELRKRFVRGVLCAFCNYRRVNSRMSALEAQRIADYLAAYEARRSA
jgi:hypothetical protein